MAMSTFEDWNRSFLDTELPFRLQGKELRGNQTDRSFIDMGEAKLEIATTSVSSTKIVHPLLFSDAQKIRLYLSQFEENVFILSPTIPPHLAELFCQRGVMFADQRGNGFASWDGIHIDVRGRTNRASTKAPRKLTPERRAASLFTPRRAQVSGALLWQPAILRSSIREIADFASVSVGTAIQTLELLTEAGYLRKTQSGYRLIKADSLLDAWAHAYPTGIGLSQQLFKGTGDFDRLKEVDPLGWISGEQAMPKLISGGNTAHIYVKDENELKKLIQSARLQRNENEEQVIVRLAFWHQAFEDVQMSLPPTDHGPFDRWPLTPLPVIYADLLSVGDPRLSEVAQTIKAQIEEHIRNDKFAEL